MRIFKVTFITQAHTLLLWVEVSSRSDFKMDTFWHNCLRHSLHNCELRCGETASSNGANYPPERQPFFCRIDLWPRNGLRRKKMMEWLQIEVNVNVSRRPQKSFFFGISRKTEIEIPPTTKVLVVKRAKASTKCHSLELPARRHKIDVIQSTTRREFVAHEHDKRTHYQILSRFFFLSWPCLACSILPSSRWQCSLVNK